MGYFRLIKAMRYGRWHILKGIKPEYRNYTFLQQMLLKELVHNIAHIGT